MNKKRVKKRKLNYKKLMIFVLIIYIFLSLIIGIYKTPIKNIQIIGNYYVKDYEIIEALKIKKMPSLYQTRTKTYKKRVKSIDLINNIEIKKNIMGKLIIKVKEDQPVLVKNNNNIIILDNMKEIDNNNISGIPLLVNYVPKKVLEKFAIELGELKPGTLSLINEVKYEPRRDEDGNILDENIFRLYMNDGNQVITNYKKVDNLKNYKKIYEHIGDTQGILNLDSGDYENYVFTPYN